jgi:uncharacterized protein
MAQLNQSTDTVDPYIAVRETGTPLGRGAYALRFIPTGVVVEIAPVVLLEVAQQPFPQAIRHLVFNWTQSHFALALGCGSIYNHADQPNLRYSRDFTRQTIRFTALRDIAPGEQLTISYDQTAAGKNPRERGWFEIHNVEKIEIEAVSSTNPR